MKQVTKDMIDDFKIMKKRIDFMGYEVDSKNGLSFHHLIVPKKKTYIIILQNKKKVNTNCKMAKYMVI